MSAWDVVGAIGWSAAVVMMIVGAWARLGRRR